MRKCYIIATLGILAIAIGYFVTSPLLAAYQLRLAIKMGDTRTVAAMVNWPAMRASVRSSVTQNAKLLSIAELKARQASWSWWQRIRSAFGHSLLDRFVERYITPQGLIELYRTKTKWHERYPRPRPEVPSTITSQAGLIPPKWRNAWQRVKSAVFISPFLFEIEVVDRHKPNRFIKGQFELVDLGWLGLNWQLTALSVRTIGNSRAKFARLNAF